MNFLLKQSKAKGMRKEELPSTCDTWEYSLLKQETYQSRA